MYPRNYGLKKCARLYGCGGLVAGSRPRDRMAAGSKPDSTEDPPCMGPAAAATKCPPAGVASQLAQVSSSSSDCGSKLRGPSLNNPRVASKRDVNIT
ncbi:hypothetical protein AVEN_210631-1 [Araneus ventricosus]|uniref:Uncharacterized protein n=1 Tax=Araneus ventricosus TaxID=182803 RepID=A0A4Y2JXS9_ARAVE|nr:hypothetical protein AVEN_210631-1 [Araneus ventricosus]